MAIPGFTITSTQSPDPADICGNPQHIDFTITNDAGFTTLLGADYAGDLIVTISTGCSGTMDSTIQIDANSFTFNDSSVVAELVGDRMYRFRADSMVANGAGIGGLMNLDAETLVNDLANGGSITIGFDFSVECDVNAACGGGSAFPCDGFTVEVDYQDHCENDLSDFDNFGEIIDQANGSFAIGQPDIVGSTNVPFSLNYCYGYTYTGITCPGANAYLMVSYSDTDNVPQSAMVDGIGATVTHTPGDTFFIVEGLALEGNISECIDIDMLYTGSLAACSAAPDTYTFEVVYDCPCCAISSTVRECANYTSVITSPGPCPCESLSAFDLVIERTTFSWTDSTMTTIASEASGADVGRALTCDDTQWTLGAVASGGTPGSFENFDVGIEIQQGFSPFEFLDGTFSVNGTPTGCALPAPTINTIGGYFMNFHIDLLGCTGGLSDGDSVVLFLNFNTLDVPEVAGDFTFLYIRSTVDSLNGVEVVPTGSCSGDAAGENFYVSNPAVETDFTTDSSLGCGVVSITGTVENNSPTGDDFPNEFRPYFGAITDVSFTVPEGYYFIDSTASINISGPNARSIPMYQGDGLTITGNDVTFSFSDTLIINDQDVAGTQMTFTFDIEPKCDSPTADATVSAHVHDELLYTQPFEPSCIIDTIYMRDTAEVGYDNLDLLLTSLTEVRNGETRLVEWYFKLCNASPGEYDFLYFAAENVSNDIVYAEVYEVTDSILNGGPVVRVDSIDAANDYGGGLNGAWVSLFDSDPSPFQQGDCRYYKLSSFYGSCLSDSITVKVAGNCGDMLIDPLTGYSGEFGTYNCANIVQAEATVIPQDPSLQINVIRQPQVLDMCVADTFEIELKNVGKGYLYDVIFDLTQPTDGIAFIPGSFQFEYPKDSGFVSIPDPTYITTNANGDMYRWSLDTLSALLASEGLHGVTGDLSKGRAIIKYAAITDCDFGWGSVFRYEGIGDKACGDTADGSLQTSFPLKVGVEEPYSFIPGLNPNTAVIPVCDEDAPHNIELTIQNNGPSTSGSDPMINDSIRVYLPNNVIYAGNSNVGAPTITTSGLQQILVFPLPSGIALGQVGTISFDVDPPESVGCTMDFIRFETFSTMDLVCPSPLSNCTVYFPTSDLEEAEVLFSKPVLTMTGDATATCSGVTGTEEVTVTVQVTNDSVAASAWTYFDVYTDDGNGVYEMTETLIHQDTLKAFLPTGDTTVMFTFNAPAGTSCGIHVVSNLLNDCTCSGEDLLMDIFSIPYTNAGPNDTICHFGSTIIGCGDDLTADGYSYTWTEPVPGALNNLNVANPTINTNVLSNVAAANTPYPPDSVFTFILTTDRNGSCASMDIVDVTVNPILSGYDTIIICQVESPDSAMTNIFLNDGHIPTEATNYAWTEDVGNPDVGVLDSTDIRNPLFKNNVVGTYVFDLNYTDHNNCMASYRTTIILDSLPVINAGPDDEICLPNTVDSYTFSATSSIGTGMWTKLSGPGTMTYDDVTSPTATVSGLQTGFCYEFEWAVSNGSTPCMSRDTVTICVLTAPNAGADQDVCGTSATMTGNTPANVGETGTWTQITGPNTPTITTPNDPTTTITGMLTESAYTFEWRIANMVCSLADTVQITTYEQPVSNANSDQFLCGVTMATLGGTQNFGTGVWTTTSGATIADLNNPNTTVTGLSAGNSYEFVYSVTNGPCPVDRDTVEIFILTTPNAGTDQNVCGNDATMSSNSPTNAGETGTWTQISGPGIPTITSPNSTTTTITGMTTESTYEFEWRINNASCSLADTVVINTFEQPVSMAGTDQYLCGVTTSTLYGVKNIGTGLWTTTSGATIVSSGSDTTQVNGLVAGNCYEFIFTVSNAPCPPDADTVQICVITNPNAGIDQEVCGSSMTLAGNAVNAGGNETGTWTVLPALGGITFTPNANGPTAVVSNMNTETSYQFVWTIDNGTCNLADTMNVNTYRMPVINAGVDQNLCAATTTNLTGTTDIGTGVWTTTSGSAMVNSSSGAVSNMNTGECHEFIWTVTNGACQIADTVIICSIVINLNVDSSYCDNNSSGSFTGDDYQVVVLTVNASGLPTTSSNLYEIIYNSNVLNTGGTPYGTSYNAGVNSEFSADGSTIYTIEARDADVNACLENVNVGPFNDCLNCPTIICQPTDVQVIRN